MKHNNISIIGIPGRQEREQGIKILFEEIMTKNFPNPVKDKDTEVQKPQIIPNKLDSKRPTPRHIIIEITRLKDKERILTATRKKKKSR